MDNFERLYNKALRFLSYRPRSEKEVRQYLLNKVYKKKSSITRHSGEEERRLQNLLTTERNVRDSGQGTSNVLNQNDGMGPIIEKVISKLKEQKFINDEEFAKWWIEQRTTFKPRSLRLIKLELRQKGIPDEIIESGIRNQESGIESDLEQAKKLVEKKIKRSQNLVGMTRDEAYQKLGSYLARRGFDWDIIKKSIDELLFKEYTTNN